MRNTRPVFSLILPFGCLKNGVRHLVFSSAAHLENEKTGLPHVDVKIDIEEYTRASGIGYTFLYPGQGLAVIMGKIRNEKFKHRDVPGWLIRLMSKEFYMMRLKFEEAGTDVETIRKFENGITECRKLNPSMLSMEDYLRREGWDKRIL